MKYIIVTERKISLTNVEKPAPFRVRKLYEKGNLLIIILLLNFSTVKINQNLLFDYNTKNNFIVSINDKSSLKRSIKRTKKSSTISIFTTKIGQQSNATSLHFQKSNFPQKGYQHL